MVTKPEQFIAIVAPHQFQLVWVDIAEGTMVFRRTSHHGGLYETLTVWERGKRGDVLAALAMVAVVRYRPFWKGLGHSEAIADFANVAGRGETVVRSYKERMEWLMHIGSVGPARCQSLGSTIGMEILRSTSAARNAAQKYFGCLEPEEALSQALSRVQRECPKEVVDRIEVGLRRVAWIYWKELFLLAAVILFLFAERVEGKSLQSSDDPLPVENFEFMWRLVLLVDLLITEFAVQRKELIAPPWLIGREGTELEEYGSARDC